MQHVTTEDSPRPPIEVGRTAAGVPQITINGDAGVRAMGQLAAEVALASSLERPKDPRQTDLEDDAIGSRIAKNTVESGGIAADRLRSLVDRIERLNEERKALAADIKDIYAEAKSAGFDVKVLRQLIRIRKQEAAEVEEQETLLDVYRRALGM